MPSITIEFTVEKGEAVLEAFDAHMIIDPAVVTNPLARLKFGLIRLARREELRYRQAMKMLEIGPIQAAAEQYTEDDQIGS